MLMCGNISVPKPRNQLIPLRGEKVRSFPKKPIFLRQDLVSRLVRDIYGSPIEMGVAWEEAAKERPGFPEPKQKSTIYRWASDGVPVRGQYSGGDRSKQFDLQIFAYCALLDVDALAIFDYNRNGYFSRFAKLRQSI
jgi:hypothetical protein